MYHQLDPQKLLSTAELVRNRVQKLFPNSGLGEVSQTVVEVGGRVMAAIAAQQKPLWRLRLFVGLGILILVALPFIVGLLLPFSKMFESFGEFMQATDAGFNVLILFAGGIAFLVSMENRVKRRRALEMLQQVRSLAHVIDMHQMLKDPGMNTLDVDDPRTGRNRPKAIHSERDLWFYLSFCCDLFSVLAKLAAWFAEHQQDRSVLQTVNGIETLCNDTARKVWQKMSFLDVPRSDAEHPPAEDLL